MSEERDTAKQVTPVVMFDDKERQQEGVKDFRPVSEYVERNRGRSKISDEPVDPENPFAKPGDIAPPDVTVGTEGDAADDVTGYPASDEDAATVPPEVAPDPEATDTGATDEEEEDDIPSPWDEGTKG